MVYAVIDEKSKRYYTYLKDVFAAIGNRQTAYNWLLTDTEIMAHSKELDALNTKVYWRYQDGKQLVSPAPEYCFLSGEELTRIVLQDDSQWLWGVLSGFDKSIPLAEILKAPFPEADGYKGFWEDPPSIQHPLAEIEIVPWDGSFVLLFSKSKEIIDSFRAAFPESQDLHEYLCEL